VLAYVPVSEAAKRVLQEALALPSHERRELAEQLVDSLEDTDPAWERAWRAELDDRLAQMRAVAEEEVSLEDVRRRLMAMVGR
jgi:putative addiction module component (TIGR02574 family)